MWNHMTNVSICEAKNHSMPIQSTVLGKRVRAGDVSPTSQLPARSVMCSKSLRGVKPRLSHPDKSGNERSRSLSNSTVGSDSVKLFTSEVSASYANEDVSTSCSAGSNTETKNETSVDKFDLETSSLSSSSSSSSSSSDISSSEGNIVSDDDNNSRSLDNKDDALSSCGKSGSDDTSDHIINSSASDSSCESGEQNPSKGEGLQYRLAAFLPQLAAANEALHSDIRDGYGEKYHIEKVDESKESYVEMDLGMGVLEERRPDRGIDIDIAYDGSDSESSDSEETQGHEDIIENLLGQNRKKQSNNGIQVIS